MEGVEGAKKPSAWKKVLLVLAIIVVVAAGVYFYMKSRPKTATADCMDGTGNATNTITYTSDRKFTPPCIEIKSGSKIVWKNESADTMDVAADPHPIHTGNKEVSDGKYTLDVKPGESAEVTMTKVGGFGYHDHEHASASGRIIVK